MAGFGITKAPKLGKAVADWFKSKSKSKWVKDKTGTITGVKAGSGKIPEHIGAGKDLKERAKIVKTHFGLRRSRKIDEAVEDVKKGKEKLKKMVDTGQAEELKGYKDRPTGVFIKKGFKD